MLRELPCGRPQQLMWLWSIRPDGSRGPFSIQDFMDLRERENGRESLGAFANWSANLTGLGTAERIDQLVEVIGVAADVKHFGLEGAPTLDLYVPFAQLPEPSIVWITNNHFGVVRANGNPLALSAAARAALAEADPDVPSAAVRTLEQAITGRSPSGGSTSGSWRSSATRRWL